MAHSVTLAGDLTDCPAGGLIIAGDNVVVDLNGHTVSAAAANDSTGILDEGHGRVSS